MGGARARGRRPGVWLVLAAGLGLLGQGLWIPAKAALAQVLLARAWERARAGDPDARPWPWADFVPVARLRVPRLGESVIVLRGAQGATLAFGPGHHAGSAPPGAPGNVVVAGHRDTHFAFLGRVREGDELVLEADSGRVRRYVVREASVRHERDTGPLLPDGGATLTLVTCWPLDARVPGGAWRLVVRAEAAPYNPGLEEESPWTARGFPNGATRTRGS